jgi:hypothetical protein
MRCVPIVTTFNPRELPVEWFVEDEMLRAARGTLIPISPRQQILPAFMRVSN